MPAFSSRLTRILQIQTLNPDSPVDLQSLAELVISEFPAQRSSIKKLLSCGGTRTKGWICKSLMLIVESDSKVRDFISTGHLAKLLARLSYVDKSMKLIGLPNPVFDKISLDERNDFFENHFHEFDSETANSSFAREILHAERVILSRQSMIDQPAESQKRGSRKRKRAGS